MERLADDVHRIALTPKDTVNAYLVGDVLVDAGLAFSAGKLLGALRDRTVTEHVLTHAHYDHAGSSAKVISKLDIAGVGVGARDAEAARSGKPVLPPRTPLKAVVGKVTGFTGVPVVRELAEGDVVGPGFVVLDAPGHSPGHIVLWREADRILITGDVFFGMNPFTFQSGVRKPPDAFSVDPPLNHASMQRLAELQPAITGFGHGPLLRDPEVLARVAQGD